MLSIDTKCQSFCKSLGEKYLIDLGSCYQVTFDSTGKGSKSSNLLEVIWTEQGLFPKDCLFHETYCDIPDEITITPSLEDSKDLMDLAQFICMKATRNPSKAGWRSCLKTSRLTFRIGAIQKALCLSQNDSADLAQLGSFQNLREGYHMLSPSTFTDGCLVQPIHASEGLVAWPHDLPIISWQNDWTIEMSTGAMIHPWCVSLFL